MKTITIMILIVCICQNFKGQTVTDQKKSENTAACLLSYEVGEWTIDHSDTGKHKCQTFVIAELPPMSQANTPMNLFITTMGTYSLKKAPGLIISDEYSVAVEDLLTGQYYNLKTQEAYTFKMNRGFNQTRFVLEISKSNSKVVSTSK